MWPVWLRREYQRVFRDLALELGRPPHPDEWGPRMSPCAKKELGIESDGMEELEAVLVPCGC